MLPSARRSSSSKGCIIGFETSRFPYQIPSVQHHQNVTEWSLQALQASDGVPTKALCQFPQSCDKAFQGRKNPRSCSCLKSRLSPKPCGRKEKLGPKHSRAIFLVHYPNPPSARPPINNRYRTKHRYLLHQLSIRQYLSELLVRNGAPISAP